MSQRARQQDRFTVQEEPEGGRLSPLRSLRGPRSHSTDSTLAGECSIRKRCNRAHRCRLADHIFDRDAFPEVVYICRQMGDGTRQKGRGMKTVDVSEWRFVCDPDF